MKNEFKHSLEVDDIVVRHNSDKETKWLETVSGQIYPLVKIKQQVFNFMDIITFNLSVGFSDKIPKLNITIKYSDRIFTESNFAENGDLVTIYVGNSKDRKHRPIKNNYYITNIVNTQNSNNVSITAQLYIPKLFEKKSTYWQNQTSLNVMRDIAKKCNLGFTTNISNTKDSMNWIQHETNRDFVDSVCEKSFYSGNSFMVYFIDQWANLNFLDVRKMLSTKDNLKLTTAPISGRELETPLDFYITNSNIDGGNNDRGEDNPVPKILEWSPYNNYGIKSGKFVDKVTCLNYNVFEDEVTNTEQEIVKNQLTENTKFTSFDFGNTHEYYNNGKSFNINNKQLLQGLGIRVVMDYYIPLIYNGMNIPLEIYNELKTERIFSQQENIGFDEINDQPTTTNDGEGRTYKLNNKYSGNVLIIGMKITYIKGKRADSTNRVQQNLILYKI